VRDRESPRRAQAVKKEITVDAIGFVRDRVYSHGIRVKFETVHWSCKFDYPFSGARTD